MKTTIKIEGMHCGGCVKSVEKALGAVPGVSSVSVDLDKGTAEIAGDDSVRADMLKTAVEDAGYDVVSNQVVDS